MPRAPQSKQAPALEEPEESPAPPALDSVSGYVVRARATRKPGLSVSFVENKATEDAERVENKATEDAERVRRNMELFESGPKYNFLRPGESTSAHKRSEQALVARAPKGKIAQLDPKIGASSNFTKFI